ncbi:uncharacterized protein TM35_000181980 [Trypanosoma theileri]|uniref:Uncharacterized protein n=1 Tax=Trypanosoma theileri TaxID=67003 RepID=A0A1X0NU53_9TRYP|nr:uncharacterized protein TM35_000181980 [Trypanosoma theileri]ORC88141.1 hypothetical protein TM35_000181980 [Trypanosoma theileri]
MSVSGVFNKGRGLGHEAATSVLRYIPRPRVPWQPSRFSRANLTPEDLTQMWGRGRYRSGPGNYNSGYSTEKTHVLEDRTVSMIPKHELEKYMPDISIGPKALVTPVSLMSARNGHRVTHDMIHSYDPHIGRLDKPAVVDHENINVEDPNRVGLNAATLDCRGRIYRWLRRGPFFQEDHYFRRSVKLNRDGSVPAATHEVPLMRKIIRLAQRGHLKAACEEYRRVTSIPPVEVYRALTACCIAGKRIADAVAIFEDGNSKLFYVARDGEVLYNLMRCAIRAKHRVRVMWVYNVMRGRYYENVVVRAEVDPIWRYRIAMLALEYLLDHNCAEEAATVYNYLMEDNLLQCDVHVRIGHHMREALAAGKKVSLSDDVMRATSLVKDVEAVAPEVAREVYKRYLEVLRSNDESTALSSTEKNGNPLWSVHGPLGLDEPSPNDSMMWLQQQFSDINVASILRWARFYHGKDLMAKDRSKYLSRAVSWIELLSKRSHQMEESPLTYMRKSKPLQLDTNRNVRVAWQTPITKTNGAPRLLAREEGFIFHHEEQTRFVTETYRHPGETLQSRFLALQPVHKEVSAKEDFQRIYTQKQQQQLLQQRLREALPTAVSTPPARILYHSVTNELHNNTGSSSSSGDKSLHKSSTETTTTTRRSSEMGSTKVGGKENKEETGTSSKSHSVAGSTSTSGGVTPEF